MDILVLGDSWASAVVAGPAPSGNGPCWPVLMGIPESRRKGISGSTAKDWAYDYNLNMAEALATTADVVIVSLMGNDLRHALDDEVLAPEEIDTAIQSMRKVVEQLADTYARVIVLLYADPFCAKNKLAAYMVGLLNTTIRQACTGLDVTFAPTYEYLGKDDFDGKDIHPNAAGHIKIATRMQELIDMPQVSNEAPKLAPRYLTNFATLKQACGEGDLALVSATTKDDGKPVALVCALNRMEGEIGMVPIAVMIDGNPYNTYNPPTVTEDADGS